MDTLILKEKPEEFYNRNKSYYERNAYRYDSSSWYFFNRYKNNAVSAEIRKCLELLNNKNDLRVLEIGPGTGYLLGKLLSNTKKNIYYTGVEHSESMSGILHENYGAYCSEFRIINEHISSHLLSQLIHERRFDLVMGSSILHHLLNYEEVVNRLADALKPGGVMYFVREPIHKEDCKESGWPADLFESVYSRINSVMMLPGLKKILWPGKVKAEDASDVAYHMFKEGVSTGVFIDLARGEGRIIFNRKYNRRVSSFMSYMENKWLARVRKDIFGNTLFSMCLQKNSDAV